MLSGKEGLNDIKKQTINISNTLIQFNKMDWVTTKNYEDTIAVLARNRKVIYNKFLHLEQRKVAITFDIARSVLKEVLDHSGMKMQEQNWVYLIKFAENKGVVDFRKMMSIYKDRLQRHTSIPRAKLIFI